MRRKCTTPRNYQGRGGIPKIEASCLIVSAAWTYLQGKNIFFGFMWEGERNTGVGGCLCVCGGALMPTLTASISHLTTCSNGQTVIT